MGIALCSLAEMHYGAVVNRWSEQKRQRLDEFLSEFTLLQPSAVIAEICGSIRAERKRIGLPIDLADAWIGATALWHDIPLVTHDRDLEGIPGLQVLTLHQGWQIRDSSTDDLQFFYRRSPFHAFPSKEAIIRAAFPNHSG